MQLFKFAYKEGESLVYFDHVLDVVGHVYSLVVNFAHAHVLLALLWTHVCGQNRPINGNHVQPRPAHDQNRPGSPPLYTCNGESLVTRQSVYMSTR